MPYHGLVRINGEWDSFGVHAAGNRWTTVWQTHKLAYGEESVACLFWHPRDLAATMADVDARIDSDVDLANRAQKQWDDGPLKDEPNVVGDEGDLHLSAAIKHLRQSVH